MLGFEKNAEISNCKHKVEIAITNLKKSNKNSSLGNRVKATATEMALFSEKDILIGQIKCSILGSYQDRSDICNFLHQMNGTRICLGL